MQRSYLELTHYDEEVRSLLFHSRALLSELGGAAISVEHLRLATLLNALPAVATVTGTAASEWLDRAVAIRGRLTHPNRVPTTDEAPFDQSALDALERAMRAADAESAPMLSTRHLVIALLGGSR